MESSSLQDTDIGYMQVHLRVYANNEIYDSFAINAEDGCFKIETNLISAHHEVIDDPTKQLGKVFQINLNVSDTESSIIMHMPIHQSTEWEIVKGTDIYTIVFFCNISERSQKLIFPLAVNFTSVKSKAVEIAFNLRQNALIEYALCLETQIDLLDRPEMLIDALNSIESLCHIKAFGDLYLESFQGWEWQNKLGQLGKACRKCRAGIDENT